jgi:hypothetical protein
LWKRYLLNNSAFLWHLSLQACKMKRYDLTSPYPYRKHAAETAAPNISTTV